MPNKDNDDESNNGPPKSTFEVYRAEGDMLFKQNDLSKAMSSYNAALELKPGESHCLVARSQCYLGLGETELALADAEETLKENKNYTKGLYQKAEALYQKGDFEFALVFYHRGHKLRPELKEFRLGIQKTEEAIKNSIGDDSGVKLESHGDLSYFYKHEEVVDNDSVEEMMRAKKKPAGQGGYQKPGAKSNQKDKRPKSNVPTDPKTVKQLLGQLYEDKTFLEKLLSEFEGSSTKTKTNEEIKQLTKQGLQYIDTRTEFWQQQQPMYSHEREKLKQKNKGGKSAAGGGAYRTSRTVEEYVLKRIEEIDQAQMDAKYEHSLKLAKKTLKDVDKYDDETLPDRIVIVGNLHSCLGNSYLEMGKYSKSLEEHTLDLEIAKQNKIEDAKSRALDNLGRVYARMGNYDKAIKVWEEKLPMSKSPLESTWLHHEIGRCYLELNKFESAKEHGEKSLSEAESAMDDVWQLNASVLIAQSQVKLNDLQAALDSFERALDMAKLQDDRAAQVAIKKAIDDVNNRIVKGMKDEDDDGGAGAYEDDYEKDVEVEKEKTPSPQPDQEPESENEPVPVNENDDEIKDDDMKSKVDSEVIKKNNDGDDDDAGGATNVTSVDKLDATASEADNNDDENDAGSKGDGGDDDGDGDTVKNVENNEEKEETTNDISKDENETDSNNKNDDDKNVENDKN